MIFLTKRDILLIHGRTIEDHGGTDGIRDESALESAIFAAENRFYYENADVFDCAAAYAFHLSKAHAFIDGNKRIGAVAAEVFLLINGFELTEDIGRLEKIYMGIADGSVERDEVARIFKRNTKSID